MKAAIVVTSINPSNAVVKAIADGAGQNGMDFIIVGDTKSPTDFALSGSCFLGIEAQLATNFRVARACPLRSYARKNVGYLLAMAEGNNIIIDTDDDNFPRPSFFAPRTRCASVPLALGRG
jgi:hypothetical protein